MYKALLWWKSSPGFRFGDCAETRDEIIKLGKFHSLQAHLNDHYVVVLYYGDNKIGECTNGTFFPFGTEDSTDGPTSP